MAYTFSTDEIELSQKVNLPTFKPDYKKSLEAALNFYPQRRGFNAADLRDANTNLSVGIITPKGEIVTHYKSNPRPLRCGESEGENMDFGERARESGFYLIDSPEFQERLKMEGYTIIPPYRQEGAERHTSPGKNFDEQWSARDIPIKRILELMLADPLANDVEIRKGYSRHLGHLNWILERSKDTATYRFNNNRDDSSLLIVDLIEGGELTITTPHGFLVPNGMEGYEGYSRESPKFSMKRKADKNYSGPALRTTVEEFNKDRERKEIVSRAATSNYDYRKAVEVKATEKGEDELTSRDSEVDLDMMLSRLDLEVTAFSTGLRRLDEQMRLAEKEKEIRREALFTPLSTTA